MKQPLVLSTDQQQLPLVNSAQADRPSCASGIMSNPYVAPHTFVGMDP